MRIIPALLVLAGLAADSNSETFSNRPLPVNMTITRTEDGDAVISLGELVSNGTTPKQARKLYENALKADRNGETELAIELAGAAVEAASGFVQAHAALAVGYLKIGKFDEAMRHIEIAGKLNPYYLPAREITGLALYRRGAFREAAGVLGDVVKLAPRRSAAHYFLGRALRELGENERARRHLETAETLSHSPARPVPDASPWWTGPGFTLRPRHAR